MEAFTLETPARQCPFLALDFETTGVVKGYPSLPWQVGAVSLRAGAVDLDAPRMDSYMRVPASWPFSRHAPGEHRANRERIASAPEALEVWQSLHALMVQAVPVAHNAGTERGVLLHLAPLARYPLWVDTLPLMRAIYPKLPGGYALERILPTLGLQARLSALVPGREAHDAFYDAVACALLLEHILSLPGWSALTLGGLVEACRAS